MEPGQLSHRSDWAMGWTTSVRFPAGEGTVLFSPLRPIRLWGSPPSYPVGIDGSSPASKRPRGKVAHVHVAQNLRMRGTVPPLPHTPSWRGTYLSTEATLPTAVRSDALASLCRNKEFLRA